VSRCSKIFFSIISSASAEASRGKAKDLDRWVKLTTAKRVGRADGKDSVSDGAAQDFHGGDLVDDAGEWDD
jgi:hypothetical protein